MKLKKLLPRSLFGRFLLIIVIPMLIVQIVSIYVFFYVYVDSISKHMARSVVSEMAFIKNSISNPLRQNLLSNFSNDIDLHFSFEEHRRFKKKIADSDWKKSKIYQYINPLIDPLNRFKSELENKHLVPYEIFDNAENDDFITVKIQTSSGIVSFDVAIKRITSSSKYVFIIWMLVTAFLSSVVSIIFLKNQLRPINDLSQAAEKFGRGLDAPNFKPYGSREIRSVAISFIKMKERIVRQIAQRTDMLSSVSHDLRTPLTRMKLQLEMLGDSEETKELKQDILDMEKLIAEYLDFARNEEREKMRPTNLKEFLQEKILNYYAKMHKIIETHITLDENFEAPIKKLALKRALINLIDNAFNYGDKVMLSASLSQNNLMILIDDNGPGIPLEERDNVFKPFYRIDNARNLDKKQRRNSGAGSGLGLAIAMDAITSHGGRIKLSDSPDGGLRVIIYIPI